MQDRVQDSLRSTQVEFCKSRQLGSIDLPFVQEVTGKRCGGKKQAPKVNDCYSNLLVVIAVVELQGFSWRLKIFELFRVGTEKLWNREAGGPLISRLSDLMILKSMRRDIKHSK